MSTFDFDKEVISTSENMAVVVDFWAPWCGPCQFLGPVIEELETEWKGKWKLVKVNTDEYQKLMQKYGIRGIPAVKMFYRGEIIAEFTGALPKYQIQKWLDTHVPDERKITLERIKDDLGNGVATAMEQLEAFVSKHDDMIEARVLLASKLIFDDTNRALALVNGIKIGDPNYEISEDIRQLGAFLKFNPDASDPKVEEQLIAAREHFNDQNYEGTIEGLIGAVMINKGYMDELPRKTCVALFRILGQDSELTKKFRRRFDMALY
ncbi:MAG: thioredoxin [Bacteroidota bacterium]